MYSVSAISLISKSHIYIVIILTNLNIKYNNSSLNQLLFFKAAIASLY